MTITHTTDLFSIRDAKDRIDELIKNQDSRTKEDRAELVSLLILMDDIKATALKIDDDHLLVRSSYLKQFISELIETNYPELTEIKINRWPYNCATFDLDKATRDYSFGLVSLDFDGVTYFIDHN